jgi:pimeloyl-ACP methyl ester carboxylesterase
MPFISLPSKPQAQITYDLSGQNGADDLVVFINGLDLPAVSWKPVISMVQATDSPQKPQMLTYDRFGQGGTTARDPLDEQPGKEPGYGHDFVDATKDLHGLLQAVAPQGSKPRRLVFVTASIGVHLARLTAQYYPGQVAGLLILDSSIGNKELSDLWPNVQAPSFDHKEVVADDCTLEQYLEASARLPKMLNSDVKSPEGLDRRNVKKLLPEPGAPKLIGPDGKGLWLTACRP